LLAYRPHFLPNRKEDSQMMAQEVHKKPPANTTTDSKLVPEEVIRSRAYELFEERGREDGHDLDDWLRAETQLIEATAEATAKEAA